MDFLDAVRQQLGYMLSLPERTIRSLAAVAGGTTTLLTETLFPEALRDTTLYKVFLGDAQKFVVEQVAQVQRETGSAAVTDAPPPDFVQKKLIGGALETAGLFAMHLSPLWVFAIASDAAAGSSMFLNRLVDQLKRNGVLPKHTEITGLTDLLVAIQQASHTSAAAVDTPPLSREELARLADDMISSYRQMFSKATNLIPRLDTLWKQMEDLARRENISFERLTGMLTIDVADWAKRGVGTVWAVGQTGTDLIGERILSSYARTLEQITAEGASSFLANRLKPFVEAATAHFDPKKPTWTERFLGLAPAAPAPAGDAEAPQPVSPVSPPPEPPASAS